MKYLNMKNKYLDFKPTHDFILIILIRLHLELFLVLFCLILSKPLTISLVILRLVIFFCTPLFFSSIFFFMITIYVIKCFDYLYNVNETDLDEKNRYIFYMISSGLITGFVTYFVLDKTVNYMGEKCLASGLLSEENRKLITEMQQVPFKFDIFCVSFFVGSSVAYLVSKKLSSN